MIKKTLALLLMLPLPVFAQPSASSWQPTKPVKLIVPVQPGAASDTIARILAAKLSERMGQPFVIENRGGAGGNIGLDLVAKAAPDGYTLGNSNIATHGINPSLYGARMPFDAIRDFAPITLLAEMKNVLVVHPSLPVNSLAELVAYSRANPGKLSFASAGTGTAQHLAGELLKAAARIDMTHVPYKGAAQAMPDLLSGQVGLMFLGVPDALKHVPRGALRGIAVSTANRSAAMPDIPPIAEQGYPDFDVRTWFGLTAPARTPPEVIKRYHSEIVAVLAQPDVKSRITALGVDAITMTPDEFGTFIRSEVEKWAAVVKASGARLE